MVRGCLECVSLRCSGIVSSICCATDKAVAPHVDYIDHPLGVFGFASTMTGDVDVSFRHEYVAGWQGFSFQTIL